MYVAMNKWVLRQLLKQSREGDVVISCVRVLYVDGPKMEKALAQYVFVACLGMTREGLV